MRRSRPERLRAPARAVPTMPSAPAFDTAAASAGGDTAPIPACWTGAAQPTSSVKRVASIIALLQGGIDSPRLPSRSYQGMPELDHGQHCRQRQLEEGCRPSFSTAEKSLSVSRMSRLINGRDNCFRTLQNNYRKEAVGMDNGYEGISYGSCLRHH